MRPGLVGLRCPSRGFSRFFGSSATITGISGPSPVDRGKKGSQIHVLSEANGIPLVVDVSAANTHDSTLLQPMVSAIPAVKSRRGPRRRKPGTLRADRRYDYDKHRRWLREEGIVPRIARRGIERNDRLSRYRWKIERTMCLAHRLPTPDHPLRTPRRALCRIPPSRDRARLLQEAPHMRQPLGRRDVFRELTRHVVERGADGGARRIL